MSDPLGNSDIEDVLSSIRRLVAGDQKGTQKSEPNETAGAEEPAQDDGEALVLTPCLRVEEADEAPDADTAVWEADGLADNEGEPAAAVFTEEGAALLDEREHAEAEEDTFPGVDSRGLDQAESLVELEDAAELVEEFPTFIRSIPSEEKGSASRELNSQSEDGDALEPEAIDASAEPAFGIRSKNAPRAGFLFGTIQKDAEADENASPAEEPVSDREMASTNEGGASLADTHDESTEGMTQPEGAPELRFVHRSVDRWLSEASTADPDDSTLRIEVDDSPDDGESDGDETNQNLFATDDHLLDEDALRALVSELLNRELQGALGERITRNVRKLVRREIHRALATRDFD